MVEFLLQINKFWKPGKMCVTLAVMTFPEHLPISSLHFLSDMPGLIKCILDGE